MKAIPVLFLLLLLFPFLLIAQSGSIDLSFNHIGKVELQGATDILVEADGKILVKGSQVSRLNKDGSVESQSDNLRDFPDLQKEKMTYRDGKTIHIGTTTIPNPNEDIDDPYYIPEISVIIVSRLNADGSPDLSFGDKGDVMIMEDWPYEGSADLYAEDAIILEDGEIIVAALLIPDYNPSGYTAAEL